jgi:hypothetical protein
MISSLEEETIELSKMLKELSSDDEECCKLLMTLPGIEYYSALLIKSEIGTIDRFASGGREKLCSYAGFGLFFCQIVRK